MKSNIFRKIPNQFLSSAIPYTVPDQDEAAIIIAKIPDIKIVKLPSHEAQRADAITHLQSRRHYLGGRHLVRGLLSHWLGIPSEAIPIELSPAGKPYLVQENELYFSISHCCDTIAVVFAYHPVGIDLEKVRSINVLALARRFFSKAEAEFIESSGSSRDFFKLWSCREAAIKADGRGMASVLELTSAEPGFVKEGEVESGEEILVTIDRVIWRTIPWILSSDIHGAVAFKEQPRVIRWCDPR